SDVWALGAILYEMVAGVAPFDAPSVADTLARIVGTTPTPLRARVREIPERVGSIVALCLSKDPALRPPSVRALLEELEAVATPGSLSLGDTASGPGSDKLGATTHRANLRSWKIARFSGELRSFGIPSMFALFAVIAAWTFVRAPRSARPASAIPSVATS